MAEATHTNMLNHGPDHQIHNHGLPVGMKIGKINDSGASQLHPERQKVSNPLSSYVRQKQWTMHLGEIKVSHNGQGIEALVVSKIIKNQKRPDHGVHLDHQEKIGKDIHREIKWKNTIG